MRSWLADLQLETVLAPGGETRLGTIKHSGPLRVQKPFLQQDGSCHIYLLHPPGGLVSGDQLRIKFAAGKNTNTLITSPSASRFYGAASVDLSQSQKITLDLGGDAHLDWLPQETIFYENCRAKLALLVNLSNSSTYVGWDILVLGRRAFGERFNKGIFDQSLRLLKNGRLIHREYLELTDQNRLLAREPWGLSGLSHVGTFVAVLRTNGGEPIKSVTMKLQGLLSDLHWGVTSKGRIILVRYLGSSTQACLAGFKLARSHIAEAGLLNCEGSGDYPRVWNT